MRVCKRAVCAGLCSLGFLLVGPRALAQSPPNDGPPYGRGAIIFVLEPSVSFEEALAVPEIASLARAGGAALLSNARDYTIPRLPAVPADRAQVPREEIFVLDPTSPGGLAAIGAEIRRRVTAFPADEVVVLVFAQVPSSSMIAARDELFPFVMASGPPADLFPSSGPIDTLTSDSTRRTGVVTGFDVDGTLAAFLEVQNPFPGEVIREVHDASAPFELHERYLAMRRMVVPVETAAGVYVTIAALVGIALLWFRCGARWLVRGVAFSALSTSPLVVALLAAGHLPALSYATVIPFVVAITLFATWALVPIAREDPLLAPVAIGVAVLMYFAVEAALGWTAALTTLHGGSELDGGRFYGLPNAFIGLLIGASVYVAHRLRTRSGFVLIVGVGLSAGLPYIGSNLGGAVSLFAAAGIWLAIRERERLGWWRGIAVVAGTVVLGSGVLLVAHRLAPAATHITRFEESSGGITGAWSTFVDRLGVGWRLIERNPFGLIPVVGLLVCLWLAFRPPTPVREALAAYPGWRDVVVTIVLGGIVAYVANDSGAAACGMAFALGFGGLMYVSLTLAAAKMERT